MSGMKITTDTRPMSDRTNLIERHMPHTKSDRLKLVQDLKVHGTKSDRRIKKSALRLEVPEALAGVITRLALRAQQGKRIHIASVDAQPFCAVEKGHEIQGTEVFRTPVTTQAKGATCKACLALAGIEDDEEFLRTETAEINRETLAPARPRKSSAPRQTKINPERFAQIQVGEGALLTAEYKGARFDARLLADGTTEILSEKSRLGAQIKGTRCRTLSKAACLVRDTPTCNGWKFWHLVRPGATEVAADWIRGGERRAA